MQPMNTKPEMAMIAASLRPSAGPVTQRQAAKNGVSKVAMVRMNALPRYLKQTARPISATIERITPIVSKLCRIRWNIS